MQASSLPASREIVSGIPLMSALSIPQDLAERALGWAFQQRLESVDVEAATLLTVKEAAAMLKISAQSFRKIAPPHVDLGEKLYRWSLKDIRQLVDSRRVKRS
jgi:predicted DNA-binding transcriptional regulator AlpA